MTITNDDLPPAARVAHASKTYGTGSTAVHALDDVSISVRAGEFTAIMGPSGSGKSTLMHVMAGLDTVSTGRVWLGEQEITDLPDAELTMVRRRSVGFVFQSFNLVPTLDVRANILLPFELDARCPDGPEGEWIDELIDVLGLADRLRHRPHELSGGQQQRVAIARAMATSPEVVFADEPTGNLDSRTSRDVLELLSTATRKYGQSIALVTHDPVAASYADRILFLADGAVVEERGRADAEEISAYMLGMERNS